MLTCSVIDHPAPKEESWVALKLSVSVSHSKPSWILYSRDSGITSRPTFGDQEAIFTSLILAIYCSQPTATIKVSNSSFFKYFITFHFVLTSPPLVWGLQVEVHRLCRRAVQASQEWKATNKHLEEHVCWFDVGYFDRAPVIYATFTQVQASTHVLRHSVWSHFTVLHMWNVNRSTSLSKVLNPEVNGISFPISFSCYHLDRS